MRFFEVSSASAVRASIIVETIVCCMCMYACVIVAALYRSCKSLWFILNARDELLASCRNKNRLVCDRSLFLSPSAGPRCTAVDKSVSKTVSEIDKKLPYKPLFSCTSSSSSSGLQQGIDSKSQKRESVQRAHRRAIATCASILAQSKAVQDRYKFTDADVAEAIRKSYPNHSDDFTSGFKLNAKSDPIAVTEALHAFDDLFAVVQPVAADEDCVSNFCIEGPL